MRVLLVNVPHPSIGSRIPRDHLPPLGLLAVGGPLIDAGHDTHLIDGELAPLSTREIVARAVALGPDAVLFGHSGSTSAHPIIAEVSRAIRAALPRAWIVYGGVFPTYHWKEILEEESQIDFIVRGEGEHTAPALLSAVEAGEPVDALPGIAFRREGRPVATPTAPIIECLDDYRIGWELIDFKNYSYWGGRRAVVIQFSRGCPHLCNYCGQSKFWRRWRHRDPQKLAAEIAWLHREHGVQLFNFADEDPAASKAAWRAFLEALIAHKLPITLVGSTRADDIVRDRDILHLYKKAGFIRFLLGTESYSEETLRTIQKGSTVNKDREAIQLLRQHNIVSMATYVVGFEEERNRDYWQSLRHLLSYDPDQIQLLYVTPHRWTQFFSLSATRNVVQLDRRRWDYKHQTLATRHLSPWRVLLWVKFMEAVMQLRPRALKRVLAHPDPEFRHAMRWYTRIGRRVWPYEIWNFFFRDEHEKRGPTLEEFWGKAQRAEVVGQRTSDTLK
jgi:anaerobic magnesium-protoporphyrin IX monomethyl ester cyclase